MPAIEFAIEKTSATRARSLTSNHLQCRHCPSLGGDLTISNFCGSISVHAHTTHEWPTKVRNRYQRVSGIERGSINFAVRRSSTWQRRRKSLPAVVGARNLIPVGTGKPAPSKSPSFAGLCQPMIGIVSRYLQPLRSKSKNAISSATAFVTLVAKAVTPSAAVLEVSGAAGVNWPSYFGGRD
ncbi:MAG TPA: hypothetical protein VF760_09775 [Xanthobacteraceae bacterium]